MTPVHAPWCGVCRAFSCLLCCFEFQLKQVAKIIASNFGFLYDAKSRAIFLVLCVTTPGVSSLPPARTWTPVY